jgi:hypothetical protein
LDRYILEEERTSLGLDRRQISVIAEYVSSSFVGWRRHGGPLVDETPENGVAVVGFWYIDEGRQLTRFYVPVVLTEQGPKMRSFTGTAFGAFGLLFPENRADLPDTVRKELSYYRGLLHESQKLADLGWPGLYGGRDRPLRSWDEMRERSFRVLRLLGAEVDEAGNLLRFATPRPTENSSSPLQSQGR